MEDFTREELLAEPEIRMSIIHQSVWAFISYESDKTKALRQGSRFRYQNKIYEVQLIAVNPAIPQNVVNFACFHIERDVDNLLASEPQV